MMPETTGAEVMCTLCGATGTVDTDVEQPAGVASALAWAVHFADAHPWLSTDVHVSEHLVMVEEAR
jgi:hypothetical protein